MDELTYVRGPPIWAAVNKYSIPGFTLNPVACPYNLDALVSDIRTADSTQHYFAAAEAYDIGVDSNFAQAYNYFKSMFDYGAAFVDVLGWGYEGNPSTGYTQFAVSHSPGNPFVMAAKVWMNPAADTALATEWDYAYSTGLDGWTLAQNLGGSLKGNALSLRITGPYPNMISPNSLNIDASNYKYIQILMRNSTSDTSAQVFWRGDLDAQFAASRSAVFTTVPNDTGFTEYTIDLSKDSLWQGRIAQLRFDPVSNVSSGTVDLQQIKVVPTVTAIHAEDATVPNNYSLSQSYPNPFNPTTQIKYALPKAGAVTLKVYNTLGQEVATLVSQEQKPGYYAVTFDASRFASGVYFYRIQAGNYSLTKKMVLLK